MDFIKIEVAADLWSVAGKERVVDFTVKTLSQLRQVKKQLKQEKIDGGYIQSEVDLFVQDGQNDLEVTKWLTEELRIPFVYAMTLEQVPEKMDQMEWEFNYYGFYPGKDEYSVESLLTVGNGFLGLRGTIPDMDITKDYYPATYLASFYNTLATEISGRTIYNEDFVNVPNFQKIYVKVAGKKVTISADKLLYMKRQLNLKNGLFQSWVTLELDDGKQLAIHTKKIANMRHINQYNLSYTFQPLNFSGEIELVSEADGAVYNYNVERYRSLSNKHLVIQQMITQNEMAAMTATTNQSNLTVCQFSKLTSQTLDVSTVKNVIEEQKIIQTLKVVAQQGQAYQVEKSVVVTRYASEEEVPELAVDEQLFTSLESSLNESIAEWQKLWNRSAITITGDSMSQKLIHLHTYHLLVSASPNGNKQVDASVTARGLHGEAYRGHIFWDELFILPFYILHFPETAKQLLMYRYQRLEIAKQAAQADGHKGAMFPWQSGLDGSEQSQVLHLNPITGEWKEDHSNLQRHVSLAIAYNIWLYWHGTADDTFMEQYGLEMLMEIALFWESKANWNEENQRYTIAGIMGPDEFHEKYPWSNEAGVTNNAYTNLMVAWLIEILISLMRTFPAEVVDKRKEKTGMTEQAVQRMQKIQRKLSLEIDEQGIIAQFEGYAKLKTVDWAYYREKYGNIYRMDRILNAEGSSSDEYQVAKQADSLMAFYNLPNKQVDEILANLGYQLPADYVEKNLAYYLARTSHGSTLSRIVHAQLAAMLNKKDLAWQLYQEALYSDYRDIQGGTTAEGIHAGVMSATLHVTLSTFGGLDIRQQMVSFAPDLPRAWQTLAFCVTVRKINYQVSMDHNQLRITASADTTVMICGKKVFLAKDKPKILEYKGIGE